MSIALSDPARDAARAFRQVLDALARPGRVVTLAGTPPPGLGVAAGAVLGALADAETPVWLPPRLDQGPVADWLTFHTNAPRSGLPVFALGRWDELVPLDQWPAGEPAYPDRGATLVVEVADLDTGPALALRGPGIDGAATIAPALPPDAGTALRANAARFPLGLDFLFTAGDRLVALPRSTRIGG